MRLQSVVVTISGLAVLAVLGSLIEQNTATAQPPNAGAARVTIVDPLPLPVNVANSPMVNAAQSGAWNVGITGTPTFQFSNTPGTPLHVRPVEKSVLFQLIGAGVAVGPGATHQFPVVNVSGFDRISVNVSITGPDMQVERQVGWVGPPGLAGGVPLSQFDKFFPVNHLFTTLDVHGPGLFVQVLNNGASSTNATFWVYGLK